ncbi:MAG: DUF192 domain-containing protein [Pseudomonadales bacterium]|nr:DUF192 domain-containing protein [Pseudomonadales bacterium]
MAVVSFEALTITIAHSWWSRLRGLLGRFNLPMEEALWLRPCSSIHTVGMLFSIDVVFLDSENVIVGFKSNIVPFYFAIAPKGCVSVLEFATGGVEYYGLQIGDRLEL